MGIFSTKKKLYVASTAYNLAGEEDNRSNFLKNTVLGSVLSNSPSLSDNIIKAHIYGPGTKQRSYYNWSVLNYNDGLGQAQFSNRNIVDPNLVKIALSPSVGETINIQSSFISGADHTYWAEKYILENVPSLIDTGWVSGFDETTNNIFIVYEDTSTQIIPATDFNIESQYIITYYFSTENEIYQPISYGPVIKNSSPPSTVGYTLISSTLLNGGNTNLTTTVQVNITYSDATPPSSSTTVTVNTVPNARTAYVYEKREYQGANPSGDGFIDLLTTINITDGGYIEPEVTVSVVNEDIGGGVIRTTTTTTTEQVIVAGFEHQVNTQEIYLESSAIGPQVWIYKIGSGIVSLDNLLNENTIIVDEFYPIIPLRINNVYVTEPPYNTSILEDVTAAYKKLTGKSINKILEDINDNPSIGDIDFSYIVNGISLNVQDKKAKKYLYNFFNYIKLQQSASIADYNNWYTYIQNYQSSNNSYITWLNAQSNPEDPLNGTTPPPLSEGLLPPVTELKIFSNAENINYDTRISWITIEESFHVGLSKPDALNGEYWFEVNTSDFYIEIVGRISSFNTNIQSEIPKITLYKQIDQTSYSKLTIIGLKYSNYVYQGKYVEINAREALEDTEESGFIIPLHAPTLNAMSIVDRTQITTANTFIIFNSYQVVKTPWYASKLFQIIIIVAIIIITIYFAPAAGSLATNAGLLGTNIGVGTAIGLTGTNAILAGAFLNALASVVLSAILKEVLTEVLGEKVGLLVAAVIGFAVGNFQGFDFNTFDINTLFSSENLLKITNSIITSYSQIGSASEKDYRNQYTKLQTNYETILNSITQANEELDLNQNSKFNIGIFTEAFEQDYIRERPNEFFSRTLLTGTDIVTLNNNMISDFTKITLDLTL